MGEPVPLTMPPSTKMAIIFIFPRPEIIKGLKWIWIQWMFQSIITPLSGTQLRNSQQKLGNVLPRFYCETRISTTCTGPASISHLDEANKNLRPSICFTLLFFVLKKWRNTCMWWNGWNQWWYFFIQNVRLFSS